METISLTSKVLHALGRTISKSPEALGVFPDYYWDIGDRIQPRQQDIRKREVMGPKLAINMLRLAHHEHLGQRTTLALIPLMLVGVLALGGVNKAGQEWAKHEVKVANDAAQTHQADTQKSLASLGTANQATCESKLDDINDANKNTWKKKAADVDPDQAALVQFGQSCQLGNFLIADPFTTDAAPSFHKRKYSDAEFAQVNRQTCAAHLADINAMATKDGWRMAIDPDTTALRSFTMNCQNSGDLASTTDFNHPVFSVK